MAAFNVTNSSNRYSNRSSKREKQKMNTLKLYKYSQANTNTRTLTLICWKQIIPV